MYVAFVDVQYKVYACPISTEVVDTRVEHVGAMAVLVADGAGVVLGTTFTYTVLVVLGEPGAMPE